MDDTSSENDTFTLKDLWKHVENEVDDSLLPHKSRKLYWRIYGNFMLWKVEKQVKTFSQDVFITYFTELSKKMKPSSLWAKYSMLKYTVNKKHNVNIHEYTKLRALLKQLSLGFTSQKSNVLTAQHIERFLNEAPDDKYLASKVALIFGINGACRTAELLSLTIDDIEIQDDMLLVKLPHPNIKKTRIFAVRDEFLKLVQKYQALRPPDTTIKRFFLSYRDGKCTKQVIGKNKLGKLPRDIAAYLKLKNPKSYTGHCFRRTSATLLAGSINLTSLKRYSDQKSDQLAEGNIDSVENKGKTSHHSVELIDVHQSTSPHPSNYHENVEFDLSQLRFTSYEDMIKITSQHCVPTSSQDMDIPYSKCRNKPAELYLEEQAEIYLEEHSQGSFSDEDIKPILALREDNTPILAGTRQVLEESIKNRASIDTTKKDSKTNENEPQTNEIALFGQLVACKIEKLTNRNRILAQNKIINILYDLELQETEP